MASVSHGHRFALAAWFTLTAAAAEAAVRPAHYRVLDPVPPPSAEEAEAAGVNLDQLRAQIERKLG